MPNDFMGVASSEATVTPTSDAPTETGQDTANVSTPSEGTSEANASISTPKQSQSTSQVEKDSVGIKNLRLHADSLKKDLDNSKKELDAYKLKVEQVETWGGVDSIKPLVDFHNNFVSQDPEEFEESGVYQTLSTLFESNPVNFGVTIRVIAEQYPDIVKDVLAKTDPAYQELLKLKQMENEYTQIPDEELDEEILTHKEIKELRKFKADTLAAKQKEDEVSLTQQQTERVSTLKQGLFSDAFTALNEVEKKVSPQVFEQITEKFFRELDQHQELAEFYNKLENAAKLGAKAPLGMANSAKRLVTTLLSETINEICRVKPTSIQQPKIEVSPKSSSVPVKKNIPAINDPNFTNAVADDWAKRFGWPT